MTKNTLSRLSLVCVALTVTWIAVGLSADDSDGVFETKTHRFREVAPGVYFVSGTGEVYTQSNAMVIVTSSDVIVADSHVSSLAARALISSIKELTGKPVRFLVNTHFHFDHVHGNEGFPSDVSIIGHDVTRQKLLADPLKDPIFVNAASRGRAGIVALESRIEKEQDDAAKDKLQKALERTRAHVESLTTTRPVPPDITLDQKLTIHRDGRAIEVVFLGRGHTGGDVVVFLPKERIVFTSDLLMPMPSYMGDGYIDEWIETLRKLRKLDFELVLPGHGEPFRGDDYFDAFERVLRTLWSQLSEMRKHGIAPEDAIRKVDLSEPLSFYDKATVPNHMRELDPRIAQRSYRRLEELERRGAGGR